MINGKPTEYLLKCIAQRLAGREDCKKVNYQIHIDASGIHMYPTVKVFPNRYRRKETDKMDIVTFVYHYKMQGVKLDELVFGRYEYQLSSDGKKRRWRKLNET